MKNLANPPTPVANPQDSLTADAGSSVAYKFGVAFPNGAGALPAFYIFLSKIGVGDCGLDSRRFSE